MKDFTHLVISRINCNYPIDPYYPQRLYDRIAEKQFSRKWLEERLSYMDKYTVPSIRSQTIKDFKWLILLHPDTPKDIKKQFKQYKDYRTRVLQTDLPPREYLPWYIKESVKTEWVATTTVDADDAISINYIEHLQDNFRKEKEYISIERGFKYVIETNRFYGVKSERNPFITLVEPTENARGVYCVVHGAAHTVAPIRVLELKAIWVQVIHGDNLLNKAGIKKDHRGRVFRQLQFKFDADFVE